MRVKAELEEIAEQKNEIGKAAKYVLDSNFIKFHELPQKLQDVKGEIEVVNLANKLMTPLLLTEKKPQIEAIITDDIKSMKKLESKTNIPIWFSTFIIYSLCKQQFISYEEGWSAIEDMKIKREWKENLIIESAEVLWEKAG